MNNLFANDEVTISPLGDAAIIVNWKNLIDETINNQVLSCFDKIKHARLLGIKDVVPAYSSLVVHYDIMIAKQHISYNNSAYEYFKTEIKKILNNDVQLNSHETRTIKVPVCYAGKYAPDLNYILKEKKLPVDEIIRLHTGKKYRIYMIGFLPGFAYMGEVDERIAIGRKAQPRTRVEAGSVGIAGSQTGIYPLESPGGWQIIGKTPLQLFNKQNDDPVLLHPGDEIEFYSITEDEFANY
jgi:inhibitor of KinA